jgi:DNA-binding transcriptional ArsR family regulator
LIRIEADIAQVGALFGESSRAAILTVLMDGRALPAGELARAAGIGATAASAHLAKLLNAGLLAVECEGRHRYYRLAGPDVAAVIEDLAHLVGKPLVFGLPKMPPAARALRHARTCYDHLAGELAVAITGALEQRGLLIRGEGKRYELGGERARRWFVRQGVDFNALKPGRYGIARQCLDWTERWPHLAGPLGARLLALWCKKRWLQHHRTYPRLIEATPIGYRKLRQELGIRLSIQ